MKYLIYARISERGSSFDHAAENSTDMQIEYCRTYVREHEGEVCGELKDEFKSGKDLKRPAMQSIVAELEEGRANWDCLCVYNLSRLTRAPKDLYTLMGLLAKNRKKLICVREPEFDFSTLAGEMMMGILSHVNQYMRKNSAAIVKDRMMSIAARGLWPVGKPPFGYKRGEKKDNKLYVDPARAVIVKDIFEMYAGAKCRTMEIFAKYKHVMSDNRVLAILRDPVYIGKLRYSGQIFEGQHEAIISEELFRKVQEKLPQKQKEYHARPKAQTYPFQLAGLLKCRCGRRLSPATAKSGAYAYYQCTDMYCKTRVSAPKVEKAALEHLLKLDRITDEMIEAACEEVRRRNQEEFLLHKPELDVYSKAKSNLEAEKQKMIDIILTQKLSKSFVVELNARVEKIDRELNTIQAKLDAWKSMEIGQEETFLRAGLEFWHNCQKAANVLINEADPERRRGLLQMYFDEIGLQEDGSFEFRVKEVIKSSTNGEGWCPGRGSNPRPTA